MHTRGSRKLAAALGLGLVACSSPSSGKKPAAAPADQDSGVVVAKTAYCPPEIPIFQPGVDTPGKNGIAGKVVATSPDPPEQYSNTWTMDFFDGDGQAIDDIEITHAQAAMPLHGHPPAPATQIKKMAEPSRYKVGLYFKMPGYFLVQLDVSSARAGEDAIEFPFCIE
jgi:hypothetical protein